MRAFKLAGAIILGVALAGCGASGATPSETPANVPSPSASAEPEASSSADPLALCAGVPVEGERFEMSIEAASFAFDTEVINGPRACQPFTITFTNNDVSDPPAGFTTDHDINIRAHNVLGPLIFDGEALSGTGGTITYEIPGLPAGEHYFYCSFHADAMKGTLIVADQ